MLYTTQAIGQAQSETIHFGTPKSMLTYSATEANVWAHLELVSKSHFGPSSTLEIREAREGMHFALVSSESGDRILGAQLTDVGTSHTVTVYTEDMLPARSIACPESILAAAPEATSENACRWRVWSDAFNEGNRQCAGTLKMNCTILASSGYRTSKGTIVHLLSYKGGNKFMVLDKGVYEGKKISISRPDLLATCPTLVPEIESLTPISKSNASDLFAIGKILIGHSSWGGVRIAGRVATTTEVLAETGSVTRKYRFV
jgi:hypothetical protein